MNYFKGGIPILLIIVAAAGGYFFAYPQWTTRADTIIEYDLLKEKNDQLKKQEQDVNSFVNKYRQSQTEIDKANKILPVKNSDIPTVLANLDKFLTESAMRANNVGLIEDSDKAAADNTIKYYDVSITTNGTYPALRNFIMLAENHLRLFDILSLNIDSNETSSTSESDIELMIRVYYQK